MASVAQRVLLRLDRSAVPVRTSVLVAQLAAPRSQVWEALRRLERLGMVGRDTRPAEVRRFGGAKRETFWSRARPGQARGEAVVAASENGRVAGRELLPARRRCVTQTVRIGGQTVHYSVGLYPDGRPAEVFIDIAKAGAALRAWASDAAKLLSVALQHGTPQETALGLFIGSRSDPHGAVTGHARISKCTSVMDCIGRSLAIEFLNRQDLADVPAPEGA